MVRHLFLTFVFGMSAGAMAHQPRDGDVYANVGPYYYRTQQRDHGFKAPVQGGWGLLAEADLDDHGGVEIGMFYMRQLYSIQKDGLVLTERGKRMYITLGYRHWFNPLWSGAITFFSSYAMGDPIIVANDFGNITRPKTSAHDAVDYGFDFSVQYEPWHSGRWAVITDLRYSASVTSKPGEDANFYGAMVSLKYFVQSREAESPEEY